MGESGEVFSSRPVSASSPASSRCRPSTSAASSVHPADGRLGAGLAAQVTQVAWPDQAVVNGRSVEATYGHRFVVFTLQLSEDTASVSPRGSDPASDGIRPLRTSGAIPVAHRDRRQPGQQVDGSTWPSASQRFTVSVPAASHMRGAGGVPGLVLPGVQPVDVGADRPDADRPLPRFRASFAHCLGSSVGQPGALEPCRRVLRHGRRDDAERDPGYFPPAGAPGPASASQAVLSVELGAEYPDNPDDPTTSGHYLGAQSPLPGSMLTFTPAGGSPVTATASDAGDTTGKGKADDGLFDATYSFVVPGNLTTGNLTINAGTFTGAEFTLFTAEAAPRPSTSRLRSASR